MEFYGREVARWSRGLDHEMYVAMSLYLEILESGSSDVMNEVEKLQAWTPLQFCTGL